MKLSNIDRILLFREVGFKVSSQHELQRLYHIAQDGTIYYFGITPDARDSYRRTGKVINEPDDIAFYEDLLNSLVNGPANEKTLDLGLEPPDSPDAFAFVSQNIALVEALAIELNAYQTRAQNHGKQFQVVLRYASEMNDRYPGNKWGQQPDAFRSTYAAVRKVFRKRAPGVLFAFSPAIRADLWVKKYPKIAPPAAYWPGDSLVDIVSCTWYISAAEQFDHATEFMRDYFLSSIATLKPFGIDEMGGCNASQKDNDGFLKRMFSELEAFQILGVSFRYVALYLALQYGIDATLAFLQPSPASDLPSGSS